MRKIYIILTHSNTMFAKFIRLMTNGYYNHVSFSFDKELNKMYSFGRLFPRLPIPGGFVVEGVNIGFLKEFPYTKMCVFEAEITEEEYQIIKYKLDKFIKNPKKYKYNILKMIFMIFNIPIHDDKRFTCSTFVAYLTENVFDFDKDYSVVRPEDFLKFNLKKCFENDAKNYNLLKIS